MKDKDKRKSLFASILSRLENPNVKKLKKLGVDRYGKKLKSKG